MSTPETSAEDRAAWIRGMRRLLDILEANPHLPLPYPGSTYPLNLGIPYGQDRAVLAAWEQVFPGPLTAHVRESGSEADNADGHYYDLDGALDGLKLRLRAYVGNVAERRVTGTRTVETVEWVRLPVEEAVADETSGEDEEEA